MPGNPVKLSAARPKAFTAPPLLGADTDAVLQGLLGYAPDRLAELKAAGVVA
jgi:crotonobetainyl-CoA:carnitine CoA-transferase CaiB-like acyl-CoA transferase